MSFLADANWKSMLTRLNDHGADATWVTKDEIAFIMGLGMHCQNAHARLSDQRMIPDRKTLLRKYLKAARHRQVWDELDREACLEMAATLLAESEPPS
jgi:hypothetical protein